MTEPPIYDQATKPTVGIRTRVQVALLSAQGESEMLEFDLVPDAEADFAHGFLGAGTPLARAIMGHAEGDTVRYRAEGVTAVRIAKVTSSVTSTTNKQAERQAVIDKAVAQSEALNDAAFAMAAGSKWGDYDPAAQVTEIVSAAAKAAPSKKKLKPHPSKSPPKP